MWAKASGTKRRRGIGRRGALLLGTAAAAFTGSAPAAAQEAAPPATVEGARVFVPADFARFAPRNALEMLRQVPGFVIREAAQERGLGQATGNVLLNGQRIAGKSDDIGAQLNRIPAQNVVRIEIVDGATLDIPGLSGQVANVIARAGRISGQFSWRPEFRARFTDPLLTRFDASVSGQRGPIEFTLGMENNSSRSGAGGLTLITAADGSLIERRHDVWTGAFEQPRISGRFAFDLPGSATANLNASYRRFFYDFLEDGRRTGHPTLPDRDRRVENEERGYNYEIGGDVEFAFGPGRLKLIGLDRFGQEDPDLDTVVTRYDDGRPATGNRYNQASQTRERIGRAEYRLRALGGDWQLSGEAAYNSLDLASRLFLLGPDGAFEEVALPNGTARVEEDRYELMASHGRNLSPSLTVQIALGGEYSRLSQAGAGGLTRSFRRPKGQISAAWKPSPRTDVNLKLQRRVGQLNFSDFIASVNLSEDRANAGNPELVPPQVWEAEAELVRNLGPWGTTSLRLFASRIDDPVDIIPIGAAGQSPGNLDRAHRWGGEWKGTFNFDPLGARGVRLDTRLLLQDGRVDDPLTGLPRPTSGMTRRLAEANLRHDVPGTDWAWGGSLFYHHAARFYRLTEVGRQSEGPVWSTLFIEHKNVRGLAVRATLANLLGADSLWDRTVYVGRRTGPIAFIERRDRRIGTIFSFQVRGRF
jgi:outer membrane receptor for ferrienterochelin and colicins